LPSSALLPAKHLEDSGALKQKKKRSMPPKRKWSLLEHGTRVTCLGSRYRCGCRMINQILPVFPQVCSQL